MTSRTFVALQVARCVEVAVSLRSMVALGRHVLPRKPAALFVSHSHYPSARYHSTAALENGGGSEDDLVMCLSRGDVIGAYDIAMSLLRLASAEAGVENSMESSSSFEPTTAVGMSRTRTLQIKDLSNVPDALHPLFSRNAWRSASVSSVPHQRSTYTANAAASLEQSKEVLLSYYPAIESHTGRGLLDTLLARKMWKEASAFLQAYVHHLSLHDRMHLARRGVGGAVASRMETSSSTTTRPSDLLCLSGDAEEAICAFCDAACAEGGFASSVPLSLPLPLVRELEEDKRACFRRLGLSANRDSSSPASLSFPPDVSGDASALPRWDPTVRHESGSRLLMFHEGEREERGVTADYQNSGSNFNLAAPLPPSPSEGVSVDDGGGNVSVSLQPRELAVLLLRTLPLRYSILAPHKAYSALIQSLLSDDGGSGMLRTELVSVRSSFEAVQSSPEMNEARPWVLVCLLLQGLINVHGNHRTGWRRVIDTSMLRNKNRSLFPETRLSPKKRIAGNQGMKSTPTSSSSFWALDNTTSPLLPLVSSFISFAASARGKSIGVVPLPATVSTAMPDKTSGSLSSSPSFVALRVLRSSVVHGGLRLDAPLVRDLIRVLTSLGKYEAAASTYDSFYETYSLLYRDLKTSMEADSNSAKGSLSLGAFLGKEEVSPTSFNGSNLPAGAFSSQVSRLLSRLSPQWKALCNFKQGSGREGNGEGGNHRRQEWIFRLLMPLQIRAIEVAQRRANSMRHEGGSASLLAASSLPAILGATVRFDSEAVNGTNRMQGTAEERSNATPRSSPRLRGISLPFPLVFDATSLALMAAENLQGPLPDSRSSSDSDAAVYPPPSAAAASVYLQIADAAFRASTLAAAAHGDSSGVHNGGGLYEENFESAPHRLGRNPPNVARIGGKRAASVVSFYAPDDDEEDARASVAAHGRALMPFSPPPPGKCASPLWLDRAARIISHLPTVGERIDSRLAEAILRASSSHGSSGEAIAMMTSLIESGVSISLPALTSVAAGLHEASASSLALSSTASSPSFNARLAIASSNHSKISTLAKAAEESTGGGTDANGATRSTRALQDARNFAEAILRAAGWKRVPASTVEGLITLRLQGLEEAKALEQQRENLGIVKRWGERIKGSIPEDANNGATSQWLAAVEEPFLRGLVGLLPSPDNFDKDAPISLLFREDANGTSSSLQAGGHNNSVSSPVPVASSPPHMALDFRSILCLSRILLDSGCRADAGFLLWYLLRNPSLLLASTQQQNARGRSSEQTTTQAPGAPVLIPGDLLAQVLEVCNRIVGHESTLRMISNLFSSTSIVTAEVGTRTVGPEPSGGRRGPLHISLNNRVYLQIMNLCCSNLRAHPMSSHALSVAAIVHRAAMRSDSASRNAPSPATAEWLSPKSFETYLSVMAASLPLALAERSLGAARTAPESSAVTSSLWYAAAVLPVGADSHADSFTYSKAVVLHAHKALESMLALRLSPTSRSLHKLLSVFATQHELLLTTTPEPLGGRSAEEAGAMIHTKDLESLLLSTLILSLSSPHPNHAGSPSSMPLQGEHRARREEASAVLQGKAIASKLSICLRNASTAAATIRISMQGGRGSGGKAAQYSDNFVEKEGSLHSPPTAPFPRDVFSAYNVAVHRLLGELKLDTNEKMIVFLRGLNNNFSAGNEGTR